jgi:hypothetical protein
MSLSHRRCVALVEVPDHGPEVFSRGWLFRGSSCVTAVMVRPCFRMYIMYLVILRTLC